MIPLSLVTGFLGCGKTTLLMRIAERFKERRLVFLVNEFSPEDVDGKLLAGEGIDAVLIPGGSIFCQCLASDFIGHLSTLPELFGRREAPVEGVVVEASGVADPRVVGKMLFQTRLDATYDLALVVTVVDPRSYLKLRHTLPNIKAQVEAADQVIVNKTDCCTEEEILAVESEIARIRPKAVVVRTRRCNVDLDPFGPGCAVDFEGDYAKCVDPNYGVLSLRFSGPADVDALEAAFRQAGDALYRAKGFVPMEGGMLYVDHSGAGFLVEEKEASGSGIECIVSGPRLHEVRALLEKLPGVILP